MKKLVVFLSIVFVSVSVLLGCGGGGGNGDSTPSLAAVRASLNSEFGEQEAFEVLVASWVKGYSLAQFVDAALNGTLESDGDIVNSAGTDLVDPDDAAVGTIVSSRLGTSSVQVKIDAQILTVRESDANQLGVDFQISGLELMLTLREQGYSSKQIFESLSDEYTARDGTTDFPIYLVDTTGTVVVPSQQRFFVLDLSAVKLTSSPTPTPTASGCALVEEGTYDSVGVKGCGLGSLEVESDRAGGLRVDVGNAQENQNAIFGPVSGNSSQAETVQDNLVIFGVGSHACTISCVGSTELTLTCFGPNSTSCTQNFVLD